MQAHQFRASGKPVVIENQSINRNASMSVIHGEFSTTSLNVLVAPQDLRQRNLRFLAIMNTFLALTSSTVCTFCTSMIVSKGKFCLDHILNASLAGAIMIASSADMYNFAFGPLLIGALAGIISTLSFRFLTRVA